MKNIIDTKKIIFIIVLSLSTSFVGCQMFDYNLTNLYPGDKIILNGFIDSELGCVVKVFKTTPATGTYNINQLQLNDVRIFLYENGDSLLELKKDNASGKYISSSFVPKVGARYKIRAISLSLPECESEEELYNDVIQVVQTSTAYVSSISYGYPGVIFSFNFDFDKSKLNYYYFSCSSDGSDLYVYTDIISPAGIDASCDLYFDLYGSYLTSKCFKSGEKLRVAIVTEIYGQSKPSILKLNLSSISPIYYQYVKSLNQPVNEAFAFIEPNTLVTNIKGGYGVFYTKNSKTFTYKY